MHASIILMLAGCSFFPSRESSPSASFDLEIQGLSLQDLVLQSSSDVSSWITFARPKEASRSPVLFISPMQNHSSQELDTLAFDAELMGSFLQEGSLRLVAASQEQILNHQEWMKLASDSGADYLFEAELHYLKQGSSAVQAQLFLHDIKSKELVWQRDTILENDR